MEDGELPRSAKTAFSQFWFFTLLSLENGPTRELASRVNCKQVGVLLHNESEDNANVHFFLRQSGFARYIFPLPLVVFNPCLS